MENLDEQGRPEPPVDGDEAATLAGFLEFQRATLEWKCRGLGPDGLRATVGASTMTLAGIVKHLALVEDDWFVYWFQGQDHHEPWASVDWKADRDWEWRTANTDRPEDVLALWSEAVDRSRRALDHALEEGDLGRPAQRPWSDGRSPSLRWILTHMIEEYARHNGHADLLRESVDGATGE